MFRSHNPPNALNQAWIDWEEEPLPPRLELRDEHAKTLLRKNDSPDIGFSWSINVYAGCTHACMYCYARRYHEYLDLSAGTDFERILFVKRDAPALLEAELRRPSWRGECVSMSGSTDCYQPVERRLGLTRAVVEVLARHRNPLSIITRSPLIARDIDLLQTLAAADAVRVQISIPILDPTLCRLVEPGTAPPVARLRAMRALSDAQIPTGVSLAPVIPGLNDHLITDTLTAAREAGARWAWMSMVRLPGSVETVFTERLQQALPDRAPAILDRIRRARGGAMNNSRFGDRMRGGDEMWRLTERTFAVQTTRLGLATSSPPFPARTPFRVPGSQLQLFPSGG